jgi:glyoxylase-like metal-dependent hydrolase (beta-lactamase superfamily II)
MSSDCSVLARPKVYQFKFGDSIITNVLEGHVVRDDLHPFVAKNATAADVEALAAQYQLPFPRLEHSFVTTIIQTPDKLIAFDPGFGENSPMPSAGFFNQSLSAAGYSLSEFDLVVISHSHPDHIGNLMTNGEATFPNAEIVYGRTEFEFWNRGENISEMRKPTLNLFRKVALPLADRIRFVEPDECIVPGLTAINAFGHSAGHLAFHFESENQQLMMLNDAVAHYVASFARPDWEFSMDDDPTAAALTRRRLLDSACADNIPVIGFHLPFPSVGYVEKSNKTFVFRPASYQFNI